MTKARTSGFREWCIDSTREAADVARDLSDFQHSVFFRHSGFEFEFSIPGITTQ